MNRPITTIVLFAVAAIFSLDASAWSLFGSTSPESLMKSADKLLAKADAALEEGNYAQASNGFVRAMGKYRAVENANPEFGDGIASIRVAYCREQLAQCGGDFGDVAEPGGESTGDAAPGAVAVADASAAAQPVADGQSAAEAFKAAAGEDDGGEEGEDDGDEEPVPESYDPRNFVYDFNEARELLDNGKVAEAIQILVPMVRYDSGNRQVRMLMAAARLRAGQNDLAIATLEDLRGKREDLPLLLLISAAYTSAGRYPEALLSLDAAVKLAPAEPDAYMNLAQLTLVMDGTKPDAVALAGNYYRQALKRGAARNPTLEALVSSQK